MLVGVNIYLRLMEDEDVKYKVKWVNNNEVRKTLNFSYPISEIGTRKWLNSVANDSSRRDFIICDLQNDKPIGYIGINNIDIKNAKAEYYIGLGDPGYWGRGLGIEASKLLIHYCFSELNLNKVYLYTWEKNYSMIKLAKRLNFVKEGHLEDDVLSHGEHRDRIIMSLLKKNYIKED
ncbi:GNAT family N-acetyltransferase [Shouchella patagoniensis]|uniref:GNAT family N-acetyltransferase n=1 Tax=Shouchella patagoniensis TaxID=228576 RepID=UPI0009956D9E|nr:GNAT family protein [Shouchella patagoniensis]